MHGYLTRDGMPPSEFLTVARRELAQYDTVQLRHVEVTAADCQPGGLFKVTLATGETLESRKLIGRDDIEKRRAAITAELLDASHQIRNEPPPSPDSIWEHVFADKNIVGGER